MRVTSSQKKTPLGSCCADVVGARAATGPVREGETARPIPMGSHFVLEVSPRRKGKTLERWRQERAGGALGTERLQEPRLSLTREGGAARSQTGMIGCVHLVCWAVLGLVSVSTARPALTFPDQDSLKQRLDVEKYPAHPGQTLELRCRLREDVQSIDWTKDGVQLPTNNRTRITAEFLQITSSVREDSGLYTCVTGGPSGSETSRFAVNVSDAVFSVDDDDDDDEDEDEDDEVPDADHDEENDSEETAKGRKEAREYRVAGRPAELSVIGEHLLLDCF
ncbi:hypothetical protein chiPu_0001431 [Chiloscyllium punctatum]|uniref:Ig-like domain-containing protein n=1 Tax=Chiloscyllium punctatum TaxID=137246 RepID=A0A401RY43_CHIPU|nr:hypothetical protein [Chiloscyllium punctatum]